MSTTAHQIYIYISPNLYTFTIEEDWSVYRVTRKDLNGSMLYELSLDQVPEEVRNEFKRRKNAEVLS